MSDKPRTQKELWEVKWVIAVRARSEHLLTPSVFGPLIELGDGWYRWNLATFDVLHDETLKFCREAYGEKYEFRGQQICH